MFIKLYDKLQSSRSIIAAKGSKHFMLHFMFCVYENVLYVIITKYYTRLEVNYKK